MFLESQLNQIKALTSQADHINTQVSHVSVGRHLNHALMVISGMIQQIITSDPSTYHPTFGFKKWFVLLTGLIPRGSAQAPDTVIPQSDNNIQHIMDHIQQVESLIPLLEQITDNHKYFTHPLFGQLTLSQTKRFMIIHTDHHLKIIRDIIK